MGKKRYRPEEIIRKLREAEVVILRTLRDIQLTLFSLFFKISYGVFPLKAPCGLS